MYLGVGKRVTVQQNSDVMEFSWQTHNKYYYMLLTVNVCNAEAGTYTQEYAVHEPGRHHCPNH